MRYLFFDIECCDGAHICEFGYVLADENLALIDRKNMTINPEKEFKLTGRPNRRPDIQLHYREKTYYRSKTFDYFYDSIKALLQGPDQTVIGYSLFNDAKFIRTACERYGLPMIAFSYTDAQQIYGKHIQSKNQVSLEKACADFGIEESDHLHKSDDDALFTLKLMRAMCGRLDMSLPELIRLYAPCGGMLTEFGDIRDDSMLSLDARLKMAKENSGNRMRGNNANLFKKFVIFARAESQVQDSPIKGKAFMFSKNYEDDHFREMLALVRLLLNFGASYTSKALECDYYVRFDALDKNGNPKKCARRWYIAQAIEKGKVKEISFEKLLSVLRVTEQELREAPFPSKESFEAHPETASVFLSMGSQ